MNDDIRRRLGLRKRSWQERMESELWEHGVRTGRVWLVLVASGLLVALALAVAVGGI